LWRRSGNFVESLYHGKKASEGGCNCQKPGAVFLYEKLDTIKIDVSSCSPEKAVERIEKLEKPHRLSGES
jgi:hypothetical protein